MESNSLDDCYFYYYSSCTKGSDCPFRHCEAALGTETVCTLWREGICYRSNCKFRHMESRINRSSIPCYWENQPGGCRKPHCVFFHHKDRSNLNVFKETARLILPVSSQPVSPSMPVDTSADNIMESDENQSLSPSHPIQPVVVSLGEAEESDTESTTSTPIKIISSLGKKISSPSKSASVSTTNVTSIEPDLGIKTLEQIRMEKIHRESEHFYNHDKANVNSDSAESAMLETMHSESNGYYPQEYNITTSAPISTDSEMESYENASLYPMEMNSVMQRCPKSPESGPGDLRNILKKKRNVPEKEGHNNKVSESSTKRIISLKKSSGAFEELPEVVCVVKTQPRNEDDMGFRIKTLDEIRKEKEKRQAGKIAPLLLEEEMPAEENDVDKPIRNLIYQIKGQSVEQNVKPDVDRPLIKLSCPIKVQPTESKAKPEGSKRKLCRKPLELYKLVQKQRNDSEENERMLERYATQSADDSTTDDDEDAAKNITQGTIPPKEENQSDINPLKRACDSEVPIASKIRKTITLQATSVQIPSVSAVDEEKHSRQTPVQLPSVSAVDEEKHLRLLITDQKNENSLPFKRRNIIRRKNFSETPGSQSSAISENSSSQHQNSDLQRSTPLQTSKLIVSVKQSENGLCLDTNDFQDKTEDIEMSDDTEQVKKASHIVSSPPSVPLECANEKGSSTPAVDELDALFLNTESDTCVDETGGNTVPKAEDLFLEFEKIIQS